MRKEIKEFAEEMETEMSYHDEDKGESWRDMDIGAIEERIEDEFKEFQDALSLDHKMDELIDIANFCMMGWYNLNNNAVGSLDH